MKYVIVTQEDPFYIPEFFKEFFNIKDELSEDAILDSIVIQEPIGQGTLIGLIKKMYDFYGPIDFIKQGVRYVLKKVEVKLFQVGIIKKSHTIESYALSNGVKLLEYKDVNSGTFIDYLEREGVDLIISVSASQIFKKKVLSTPRYGCVNLHNAPLPKYKGMLPNFWQMLHDEENSVLTIHYMNEKLDEGDIIDQYNTPISKDMSLDDLMKLSKKNSAKAVVNLINRFCVSEVVGKKMPKEGGSYFTFPSKLDVKKFKKMKKRLI